MLEDILEQFQEDDFLTADGFNEAVIGVDEASKRIIYSVATCIGILARSMTLEEAIEHFEFNVQGAYVGEKTPIWCWDML